MWVNRKFFDLVLADNKKQQEELRDLSVNLSAQHATIVELRAQKAKDDITIDWMRHRINALEKQNAVLMQKATGVAMPVPEIVPTRPGTIAGLPIDFSTMPSFEDVGDEEARRLGIQHLDDGTITYDTKKD